jgi:hypothetical protein
MGVLLKVTPDTVTCTTWLPATTAATVMTIWALPTKEQDEAAVPLTTSD